jgi:hypothetical protein
MSGNDRRKYLTASALDQDLLDWCHDNLETKIEMICEIVAPDGSTIYVSDRNKYVGSTFYQARLEFPSIKRTLGEWLDNKLEFSTITIDVSNVDGVFNKYLPGGTSYGSFINRRVTVKIGLDENASTYTPIFDGVITEIGGAKRSTKSITITARDKFGKLDVNFPTSIFTRATYTNIEASNVGKVIPVIYGDYTVNLDPDPAIVPSYCVNGQDPYVNGGQQYQGTTTGTPIADASRVNVKLVTSSHPLSYFDTANVWLKRSDIWSLVPSGAVANVASDKSSFEVVQNGTTWVQKDDGTTEKFLFQSGDTFYVRVKGKDLSTYSDNLVWQARDILITYGGVTSGDFDSKWATYRDKSTPSQSAISSIKSRAWIEKQTSVIEYALSMLEQVRLEAFISRGLQLSLNAMHFEDWPSSPTATVKNWDIVEGTFKPSLDERTNFNRAQGFFDYRPNRGELGFTTPMMRNQASIDQIGGKLISKEVDFPNLYIEADVKNQLKEIIRMSSALHESVEVTLTWRSMLRELGDFAKITVNIGGTVMTDVPMMFRQIEYDPQGITVPVKGWLMAILPYPGYTPGYSGTVGGYSATITDE